MGFFGWFCGVWFFYIYIYVFSIFDPDSSHTQFSWKSWRQSKRSVVMLWCIKKDLELVPQSSLFRALYLEVGLNKY